MTEPAVTTTFVHTIKPRSDNLALLAEAVRAFLEPRHHVEYIEHYTKDKTGTTVRRRDPHTTTHPGLLQALEEAASPGSVTDAGSTGGSFESRPAASIPAVNLLREIQDGTRTWADALRCRRPTTSRTLSALVGAHHTDGQLDNLRTEVTTWRRRAEIVIGWTEPPRTIGDPCPNCWRTNCLTITGDFRAATCNKCGYDWDETTIGLLSQMLIANQQQETVTGRAVCAAKGCYLAPGHYDDHRDHRGRHWASEWGEPPAETPVNH